MSDSIIVNVNPSSTDLVVINANPNTTNQSVNVNDGITTSIINVSSISPPNVSINPTDLNIDETININQGGFVFSVNGKIGHVIITKGDIGLDQVDNTSDLNKPLSLAQIAAFALKANQSDLSLVSAAQDAFYVDTARKVNRFAPAGFIVETNSSRWIQTSNVVLPNYVNWNEAFSNISQNSAFYVGLSTASVAIWDSNYTNTRNNSAFWQQAYTNLLANSSSYIAGGNLVNVVTGYLPLSGGFLTGNVTTSAILSSNNVIYALGGDSNLWNSVYSFINSTSANEEDQNEVVSFILANSSNILQVNSKVNGTSGNWDSGYTSWNSNSANLIAVENFVKETSANNSVFNTVFTLSSDWNSVYSSWNSNSALDLASRTFVNNNSSNIIQVNSKVNTTSSNWDSVYSSWNSNSALDLAARTFVNNTSANISSVYSSWNSASSDLIAVETFVKETSANNSVFNTVCSLSANWNSSYTTYNLNSAFDITARTFVNSNSANLNQVSSKVNNTSANWDSVYTSWNSNSALDLAARTFVNSNSANLNQVSSKVNNTSANWDSVYTSWNSASADLIAVETFVKETSANNSVFNTVCSLSANWNSVYSSWNSNSALDLAARTFVNNNSSNITQVNSKVNSTSGRWDSVYSIYQTNSAFDIASRTFVNNNSSNIVQVNTLVNNNSAEWDSIYSLASGLSGNWSSLGTLTNTIVTDLSVGAITAAQVLPAGTTFQQFAEALLTKIYYPTYTNRSLTVTSNLGGNGTNVEIGTQSVTLTLTYNRGLIRGKTVNSIWDPNFLQGYRTGTATNYVIFGNTTTLNSATSANATIFEGANTYSVTCNYGAGDQPVDSRNNPFETALPPSSVSNSITLNGRRRAFFGADTNNFVPTNSNQVRALPQNLLAPVDGSTFTVNVANGASRVVIAYPATLRNVTQIYYPPLQSDVKTTFLSAVISVSAANSLFPTNYKMYYYIPQIPFGSSTTYQVTI